jgi:hypothetical protein
MTGIPSGWIPFWGRTTAEVVRNRRRFRIGFTLLVGLFVVGAGIWAASLASGVQPGPSWQARLAIGVLLADLIPFAWLGTFILSIRRRMGAHAANEDSPNGGRSG